MRSVICAFNISIDGCYDHTKMNGSPEIHQYFADLLQTVDQSVTGRKMFEIVTPYWEEVAKKRSEAAASNNFADALTAIPETIVSTTMQEVPGGPRIIRGNVEEEIRRLKALPGKRISIGGMSLRAQLMKAGLIDELYVVVHPAIVGPGPRWMEDTQIDYAITMKLAEAKVLGDDCVALHYVKAESAAI